jgi:hypothetical protein
MAPECLSLTADHDDGSRVLIAHFFLLSLFLDIILLVPLILLSNAAGYSYLHRCIQGNFPLFESKMKLFSFLLVASVALVSGEKESLVGLDGTRQIGGAGGKAPKGGSSVWRDQRRKLVKKLMEEREM